MDRALSMLRRRETAAEIMTALTTEDTRGEPSRKRDASRRLKNAVIGSKAQ